MRIYIQRYNGSSYVYRPHPYSTKNKCANPPTSRLFARQDIGQGAERLGSCSAHAVAVSSTPLTAVSGGSSARGASAQGPLGDELSVDDGASGCRSFLLPQCVEALCVCPPLWWIDTGGGSRSLAKSR